MAFDLIGRYPVSPEGSRFRMNHFTWPPFVDLLHDVCAPRILRKCRHWYTNDEDGLREEDALALAKDLQRRLDDGGVERALERRTYDFGSYHARAEKRGGRHAQFARLNLATIEAVRAVLREAEKDDVPVRENADIVIDRENAEEFVTFLKHCGGFWIC